MEDEQQKHEILTNGPNNNNNIGSPESPNLKTRNNINKEQDRFLPIANVGRIMKKVIPGNGKISKDAKETVQECVSEFISFVTGEASDKCQREKRKTINGDHIIWAITTLGFEDYFAPLKLYLSKFREIEGETLNIPKQQQCSNSSDTSTGTHSHFTRSKGMLALLLKTFREEENNTVTREGWIICVHANTQTNIANKPSQVLGVITPRDDVITPKTETWSPENSPWRDHA